jgi:multidrug transporter EmrE-like cation transporter
MRWFVAFLIFMVFEASGNFLSGILYSNVNFFFLLAILAIYAAGNSFWLISLKNGSGLARGAVFFSVGIVLTTASIGIFYFGESATAPKLFGIVLGIVSLVLMTYKD